MAGAVVGSVGGITILLLLALMAFRWHKQRKRSPYPQDANESVANLASGQKRSTMTSPGQGMMTENRRAQVPSAMIFGNPAPLRNSPSPNRSSSPTLGARAREQNAVGGYHNPNRK